MNGVEQELLRVSGFTPERNYHNRQDYLAALIVFVSDHLKDEEFETLTEEASVWCNQAATAHRNKKVIKDFEGGGDVFDETIASPSPQGDSLVVNEESTWSETVPARPKRPRKPKAGKANLSGAMNKYGIAIGTKSHTVTEMLERGTTMKEINEAMGSTYYNLIRRLEKAGHTVAKNGTFMRLTVKP